MFKQLGGAIIDVFSSADVSCRLLSRSRFVNGGGDLDVALELSAAIALGSAAVLTIGRSSAAKRRRPYRAERST